MDLQSIFYVVGIIFMVMMIGLLLSIAYFLTKVQQSIQSMRENIVNKQPKQPQTAQQEKKN
jgi:cell division protein FtsL